jgi:hypothetical protein
MSTKVYIAIAVFVLMIIAATVTQKPEEKFVNVIEKNQFDRAQSILDENPKMLINGEPAQKYLNLAIAKDEGYDTYERYQLVNKAKVREQAEKKFKELLAKKVRELDKIYSNANTMNKNDALHEINELQKEFLQKNASNLDIRWDGEVAIEFKSGKYDGYNGERWSSLKINIIMDNGYIMAVNNTKSDNIIKAIKKLNIKTGDTVYFEGKLNSDIFMPSEMTKYKPMIAIDLKYITK